MKILLTGATGFIGSAFTRVALKRGHKILGLVLPGEKLSADFGSHENFVPARGTLQSAPWDQIEAFAPESCVHAAWITTPGVYLESPDNYLFLEQSLEFLHKIRAIGTRHLLVLGTCIEYRISHEPLSEESTPIEPTTKYANCKNDLRVRLESEKARDSFTLAWARVFYPYGPGEHPSRLCTSLIEKLCQGQRVSLKTPTSTKDYIYIDDLGEALLKVLEKRFEGCINLGTGIGISVREIAERLGKLVGRSDLIAEAFPPMEDALDYVVADIGRLATLGWRPTTPMDLGLRNLLQKLHPDFR